MSLRCVLTLILLLLTDANIDLATIVMQLLKVLYALACLILLSQSKCFFVIVTAIFIYLKLFNRLLLIDLLIHLLVLLNLLDLAGLSTTLRSRRAASFGTFTTSLWGLIRIETVISNTFKLASICFDHSCRYLDNQELRVEVFLIPYENFSLIALLRFSIICQHL